MRNCKTQLCEIYRAIKEQHQLNELMVTIPMLADPNNDIKKIYVDGELMVPGIRDVVDDQTYLRTNGSWIPSEIFLSSEFYKRIEHINVSLGSIDAGKPIVLNSIGQIDPSMLNASSFYYVGAFTPTALDEYPDTTGESSGAFWVVEGLGVGVPYLFTTGDLIGRDITDGDFMVWGSAGWSIMFGDMNPTLYYKLDGTNPLTADFQGGGFLLKNIANGVNPTDAVTLSQLGTKENLLGNPTTDGYVLASTIAGVRSWIAAGSIAPTFTNPNPTPVDCCGIPAGSTFNNVELVQMWQDQLYPYQLPAFTSFDLYALDSSYEVGYTISAGLTPFSWATSNPSNVEVDSIVIEDLTNSVTLGSDLPDNSYAELSLPIDIQKIISGSHNWQIKGLDTNLTSFTRNASISWLWKNFWGNNLTGTIIEADILAGASRLDSDQNGNYHPPVLANAYKWIAYPKSYGLAGRIIDTSTGFDVAMDAAWNPGTVAITNAEGIALDMHVYRSANQINGDLSMDILPSIVSLNAIPGTVPLTGIIAPTDVADKYPVTDQQYNLGGYRSVDTIITRDAIPTERRIVGMLVYVEDTSMRYKLEADLTTWKDDSLGFPTVDGMILSSLIDGTKSWINIPAPPSTIEWGSLTGDIGLQTDLGDELDLRELQLGNPVADNYILSSTILGVRSWVAAPISATVWGDITGDLRLQTDLDDQLEAKELKLGSPTTDGYVLASTISGIRSWVALPVAPPPAATEWGDITGDITAQQDLDNELLSKEPLLPQTGTDGYVLSSTIAGVKSWVALPTIPTTMVWGSLTGDIGLQIDLNDELDLRELQLGNPTADNYILSSTILGVRSWIAAPISATVWGDITGDMTNQQDLDNELLSKEPLLPQNTTDGYVLASTIAGVKSWVALPIIPTTMVWGSLTGDIGLQTDLEDELDLRELQLGDPTVDGYVLASTIAGVRSWVALPVVPPPVVTEWGDIIGDITDQQDLDNELLSKEPLLPQTGTDGYVLASTITGVKSWVALPTIPTTMVWGSLTGDIGLQTDLGDELDLRELQLGDPGTDGYVLASTAAGVRSWVALPVVPAPTVPEWGDIIGDITAQQDLDNELLSKEPLLPAVTTDGYVLASTIAGARSWVALPVIPPPVATEWGTITGDIRLQTDLDEQLENKELKLGNPTTDGYVLSSEISGIRSWIPMSSGGSSLWEAGTAANSIQIIGHTATASGIGSLAGGMTQTAETIQALGVNSFIYSSSKNRPALVNGTESAILGGYDHQIGTVAYGNAIIGGHNCSINGDGYSDIILGAGNALIESRRSFIITGDGNSIIDGTAQIPNGLLGCSYTEINGGSGGTFGIGIQGVSGSPVILSGHGVHLSTVYVHDLPTTGTPTHNVSTDASGRLLATAIGANINSQSSQFIGNLGNNPSNADILTIFPNPIIGEIYKITDTSGHAYLLVNDGTDFWYEKLTKAN